MLFYVIQSGIRILGISECRIAASWILIHSHSKAGLPSFEGALADVMGNGDHHPECVSI
jgi:hypothetical protein